MHRILFSAGAAIAALAMANCASSPGSTMVSEDTPSTEQRLVQVDQGVYALPANNPDGTLALSGRQDVRVLVMGDVDPKSFSEVHIRSVADWVRSGGVLWIQGRDVESGLYNLVVPVKVEEFEYHKAPSGVRGGELIVRGSSPRLVIHDTPLTRGVQQLYIHPRWSFNGTANARPVVEMTDAEGRHGVVIAMVPLGQGYIVLDGTAREGRFFDRLEGFDPDHPNAVKVGGEWNSYDWNRLIANAEAVSRPGGETFGTGQAPPDDLD